MNKIKKSVIIVHRGESTEDFNKIASIVKNIDPSIGIATLPFFVSSNMVPREFFQVPSLVIYLCNSPTKNFTLGEKLAVKNLSKIDEYAHFKQNNLPCLPIEHFKYNMHLDPDIYGDWVILKPENMQSSGNDINMVPTKLISQLQPSDFPANHLIHKDSYLVQKFVKTGDTPSHYRVLVFLDTVMYSRVSTSHIKYPEIHDDLSVMLSTSVASNFSDRTVDFFYDEEINNLALKVASTFPEYPIFGIDIIRDENSGNLIILEANLGGNVWHFSSLHGQQKAGNNLALRDALISQYNAWESAAKALVRKANTLKIN